MGKKCFVPRCTTGYKTCREKFSLFRAPKDEAQLNLWRHAIPRKDRRLEATDHVYLDSAVQRKRSGEHATTRMSCNERCANEVPRLPFLSVQDPQNQKAARRETAFGTGEKEKLFIWYHQRTWPSEECASGTVGSAATFVTSKLVEIDAKMQVTTVLMGKTVSMEQLPTFRSHVNS
ncbi:hypothetical protein HPB47_017715 [Ixodes persulcatus]|uniref:Uncharacterized protein n=1 Tax=Ixodes persulcatus TaxID=34615 RepID=A0AC60QMK8_IXOPE|nr:hypothetical protein HPB47_017715 [Ixodes persulcatus]